MFPMQYFRKGNFSIRLWDSEKFPGNAMLIINALSTYDTWCLPTYWRYP